MSEARQVVSFFEVDQPECALTYGLAPCTAVLGVDGENKCHNTRFTCQDPANYTPTSIKVLRFSRSQEGLLQYGNVLPMIEGEIESTPAAINLASMNKSMSSLGGRETVSVTLNDRLHDDAGFDKYRLERKSGAAQSSGIGYDPYTRGTFIGKWIARNPYFSNYACRVREGFLGDALEDMRVRNYILEEINGPKDGKAVLQASDLFSLVEARKAVAPLASTGELLADITDVAGSGTLSPTGIGDEEYPASGNIQIGDESITFTRAGDVLTFTVRGALGSTAESHQAEDLVQLVLSYVTQRPHDIAYDLLVTYSEIPAASIPKTTWDLLAADITELYTARITKPTPVLDLIGEICEQAGFTLWPDVSTGEIKFTALRPSVAVATVDDDGWILGDPAIDTRRQVEKRVSQLWVYYGVKKPNEDLKDERNFYSRYVTPDLESEGTQQYGTPAIRQVFSRWIPQFGRTLAQGVGARLLAMFRDPPRESKFSIHASRDGQLVLAQTFTLRTAEVQDETGEILDVAMVPIEIERGEQEIAIKAQQITFSGGGSDLGGNDRTIYIENDSFNLNLRTIHDSLYSAPTGVENVTFIGVDGFKCGSSSISVPAMDTGDWPSGVALNLVTSGFKIQGKGGKGGNGTTGASGNNGENGGDALRARYPITVNNTGGKIWAGSGAGGASSEISFGGAFFSTPGGGGAGTTPGDAGTQVPPNNPNNTEATSGTEDAGGLGADGQPLAMGGNGGAPGLSGSDATGPNPGLGGQAGRYIDGNSMVTWAGVGDVRGGISG